VRLITFRNKSRDITRGESAEEIGALIDGDTKVIGLQSAEQLRRGQPHPHQLHHCNGLAGFVFSIN